MKKETIMRFISVPTAKGLCGARRGAIAKSLLRYLSAHLEIPLNIRSLPVLEEIYR